MVAYGRVELLSHPLSQKYLQMKWNTYGKYFHVTNLLIYIIFLSFVTIYASQLMQSVDANNTSLDQMENGAQNFTAEVRNFQIIHSFSESIHLNISLFFASRNSQESSNQDEAAIDRI